MTKKHGIRYSKNLKDNIIELSRNGKKVKELSQEYDIPETTIYRWKKKRKKIKTKDGELMTNEEIKNLKKEMNRIKTENEILKKTLKILSKE